MSLYGALFAGVSGLAAQAQNMGMISDNIANLNTIGYKRSFAKFATLVTNNGSSTRYSPGGVESLRFTQIDQQGLLQTSTSPTDIALSGNGFFVVNTSPAPTTMNGEYQFTRAGSFTTDKDGYLVNSAGKYLLGWQIDAQGNIPTVRTSLSVLQPINVGGLAGTAEPSTRLSIRGNLQASEPVYAGPPAYTLGSGQLATGAITADFARSFPIVDSQGSQRTISVAFLKTGTNTWSAEIYADLNDDGTIAAGEVIKSGTLAFNTDGSLDAASSTILTGAPANQISIPWAAALGITTPQVITLDLGTDGMTDGFSQFDTDSQLLSSDTDGTVFGSFSGVTIDEHGYVTALFNNGTSRQLYKLPIATFVNPNGLVARDGNAWVQADAAGEFNLFEAGTGPAGKVAPSALESATVDLAEEFSNMIVTQRAYSANAKTITTADEMLAEIINLKR
jgi:flagellar hook protein FlgE